MAIEWRPIESAPLGSWVLIATKRFDGGVVMAQKICPTCSFEDMEGDTYEDASHWMPLPSAPTYDKEER